MSIRTQFILTLAFSLFALAFGISSAAHFFAARKTGDAFAQNAGMQMDRVEDIVHAYFTTGFNAAKILASLPEASGHMLYGDNGGTDAKDGTVLLRRFESLASIAPGVEAVFCGYRNGLLIAFPEGSGNIPGENAGQESVQSSRENFRKHAWYSDAALGTTPVSVTGAYISDITKSLAATFSAKIKNGSGETVGVAAASVSLASLVDALRDIQPDKGGYLVIFDGKGRIILDPEAQENLLLPAEDSGDQALKAMARLPAGVHTVTRGGTEYAVYVRSLANARWKGVILMDARALSGPADSLTFSVALASLAILLAVFTLGSFAAIRATRPLHALIRQSNALAEGNAEALESIPGRGPDISVIHGNLGRLTGRILLLLQAEKERSEESQKTIFATDASQKETARLKEALHDAQRLERKKAADTLRPIATDLAAVLETLSAKTTNAMTQTETLLHAAGDARDAAAVMGSDAATFARQAVETEKNAETSLTRAANLGAKYEETARNLEGAKNTAFALAGNLENMKSDIAEMGEMAASVRDIADQANLLAFNVSLDANSAGGAVGDLSAVVEKIRAIAENAMTVAGTAEAVTASFEQQHSVQVLALNKTLAALRRAVSGNAKTDEAASGALADITATIEQFRVLATALEGAAQTGNANAEQADALLALSRNLAALLRELADSTASLTMLSTRLSASAEKLHDEKSLD